MIGEMIASQLKGFGKPPARNGWKKIEKGEPEYQERVLAWIEGEKLMYYQGRLSGSCAGLFTDRKDGKDMAILCEYWKTLEDD